MSAASGSQSSPAPLPASPRPVAVIDIGATSIRMAIAQINAEGRIENLESLSQAVSLGKDVFTKRAISKSAIEECVRVLSMYREKLGEYRITSDAQIRAIATSAVREAANRDAFVDRVYIATGIRIDVIDEADVNRFTYLSILPLLKQDVLLCERPTLVVEVGGGITKMLVIRGANVEYSGSFWLGSLRMREMLEGAHAATSSTLEIMHGQIDRTLDQVRYELPAREGLEMVALGGEIRFAASQLLPDWDQEGLTRLPVGSLSHFTDHLLSLSVDDVVRKYRITYQDAETLAPALLAYVKLARMFNEAELSIATITLRDGLLREMAVTGSWTEEFQQQIVRSALALGNKYEFNEAHARQVADLSRLLFRALQPEHKLDPRYELLLYIAALLHEIGLYVSNQMHHKHSMYLIQNSELFGLGRKDILLVALVARYHRRASPKPVHEGYSTLDLENRIIVAKLAAILRVADALERSHSQRVRDVQVKRQGDVLILSVPHVPDLALEQLALSQKGGMFEDVYGMRILLRRANL